MNSQEEAYPIKGKCYKCGKKAQGMFNRKKYCPQCYREKREESRTTNIVKLKARRATWL